MKRGHRPTVLDLAAAELPPRFLPPGTPWVFDEPGRCRWCGALVERPRRTWCSEACVIEWTVRTSGSFVRSYVFKRDAGVCADCGAVDAHLWGRWDADHIVPVWKGGGLAGLAGYQTLCGPCHARKTATDAAERAALRRPAEPPPSQLELRLYGGPA